MTFNLPESLYSDEEHPGGLQLPACGKVQHSWVARCALSVGLARLPAASGACAHLAAGGRLWGSTTFTFLRRWDNTAAGCLCRPPCTLCLCPSQQARPCPPPRGARE